MYGKVFFRETGKISVKSKAKLVRVRQACLISEKFCQILDEGLILPVIEVRYRRNRAQNENFGIDFITKCVQIQKMDIDFGRRDDFFLLKMLTQG